MARLPAFWPAGPCCDCLIVFDKPAPFRQCYVIILGRVDGYSRPCGRIRGTGDYGKWAREGAVYSAFMLAARITFAHFEISFSILAANSSGVLTIASKPREASFSSIPGWVKTLLISL